MPPRLLRAMTLAVLGALAAVGAPTARAETVDFSYSWSMTPQAVIPGTSGSVQFALNPAGTASYVMGAASPTQLSGATLSSTVAPGATDTYNAPFNLKLALTDSTSGATANMNFAGTLAGSVSSSSSTLTSTFTNPLTQGALLGTHYYQVTIDPTVLALPQPGSMGTALLDALVRVKNINGGDTGTGGGTGGGTTNPPPTTSNTPEPSSLVLGGLAVAGLAARRWSRRRRPG